jgi:hypothetical protein
VLANAFNTHFNTHTGILGKLIYVSFMPWIAIFVLGAYASTSEELRNVILRVNILWLIAAYLVAYELSRRLGLGAGNGINFVTFALLAALTLKCAYTRPDSASTAQRYLLRRVYLSHAGGELFSRGRSTDQFDLRRHTGALTATATLGILSWIFVEWPALRLKKATLRSDTKGVELPPNTQRQPI